LQRLNNHKEQGATEITKQEYDALNTQGESETIKERRAKKEKRMRLFTEQQVAKNKKPKK